MIVILSSSMFPISLHHTIKGFALHKKAIPYEFRDYQTLAMIHPIKMESTHKFDIAITNRNPRFRLHALYSYNNSLGFRCASSSAP